MYAYIHTDIQTYIHAYIRTYVHTYIHSYIHTNEPIFLRHVKATASSLDPV